MMTNDKNTTSSKTETTAATIEYRGLKTDTASLLERLQAALTTHDASQATEPKHYGYVGDLHHVCEQLLNLVEFVESSND